MQQYNIMSTLIILYQNIDTYLYLSFNYNTLKVICFG